MAQTRFTGTFTIGSAVVICAATDDLSALVPPAKVVIVGLDASQPAGKTTLPIQSFSKVGNIWRINLAAPFANASVTVAAKVHTGSTSLGFNQFDTGDTAAKPLLNDDNDLADQLISALQASLAEVQALRTVGADDVLNLLGVTSPSTVVAKPYNPTSLSTEILADGPMLFARLNEAYGAATVKDSSANALTGTLHNVSLSQGHLTLNDDGGDSGSFPSSYVDWGNPAALQITGAFSLCAFVTLYNWPGAAGVIMGKGYDGNNEGYVLAFTTSGSTHTLKLFTYTTSGNLTRSVSFDVSAWTLPASHLIHATCDAINATLYVDGVAVATGAFAAGAIATTAPFYTGAESVSGSAQRNIIANIGDHAVFASALSAARVAAHFRATRANARQLVYPQRQLGIFIHCSAAAYRDAGLMSQHPTSQQWHDGWAMSRYNMGQWLDAVAASGARYAILTTKHDLGGCIWFSTATSNPRHIGNTVFYDRTGIDIVDDYTRKCRARGIVPCLYWNLYDPWWVSDRPGATGDYTPVADFVTYVVAQVTELLTKYGPIGGLWVDSIYGIPAAPLKPALNAIRSTVAALQPNCVIVGNSHTGDVTMGEIRVYEGSGVSAIPGSEQFNGTGRVDFPPAANTLPCEYCENARADDTQWTWIASGENAFKDPAAIYARYKALLARNSAYALNYPPNTDGLLPDGNVAFAAALGTLVKGS